MKLTRTKVNDYQYTLYFGELEVGKIEMDVDGFFYWWDNEDLHGCSSSWELKEIARHLDELNKPYEDSLNEYFSKNPEKDISQ